MNLIATIRANKNITCDQLAHLLFEADEAELDALCAAANEVRQEVFGNKVYIRGLIEFTNYCKNNCYYCGIRQGNSKVSRYRLTGDEIYSCASLGYKLGFRTFVLQGGEDPFFTCEEMCEIVAKIRQDFPDCAITLSVGEKSREEYQAYFDAGANRFLLRHETACKEHYEKLHPAEMSFDNRRRCLQDLKEIGFQTGCGFMVGSPGQTVDTLYQDLQLIKDLQPEMVGIGPFIPQGDTPFAKEAAGTLDRTLRLLSIIRLIHPQVLLPATTALGTIAANGREQGILHGANVVMPNLSPGNVRDKYILYDNKICTGDEAAECLNCMKARMKSIGFEVVVDRGDYPNLP